MVDRIQLGRWQYCPTTRFIYQQDDAIALEPKMADVLDYLLRHPERYVALQELHSQVWQGRIVTDTAVRRVISRLRAVLEVNADQPEIILSLPKRGYRLICSTAATPAIPANPFLAAAGAAAQAFTPQQTQLQAKAGKLPAFLLLILLLCTAGGAIWWSLQAEPVLPDVADNLITILPDYGRVLAVSATGSKVLYQVQRGYYAGYDIFMQDIPRQQSTLLASGNEFVAHAIFINQDQDLLLSFNSQEAAAGRIELWQLSEQEKLSGRRTLLDSLQSASFFVTTTQADSVLVSLATPEQPGRSLYYQLSWTKQFQTQLTALTASPAAFTADIAGALSADQQVFAYQRNSRLRYEAELQLLNMQTGEIALRVPYPRLIRSMQWQNAHKLLVLDDEKLSSFDRRTGQWQTLSDNPDSKIRQLAVRQQTLLIEHFARNRQYMELKTENGDWHGSLIQRPVSSVSLRYRRYLSEQKFEVSLEQGEYRLEIVTPTLRTTILRTEAMIEVMDEDSTGRLLLRLGDRLAVLPLQSGDLMYLLSPQDVSDSAVFTADGQAVLFSLFSAGQWSIQRFELLQKTLSTALPGFRAIRTAGDGYASIDQQGNLVRLDNKLQPQHQLQGKMYTELSQWQVAPPYLYSMHDGARGLQLQQQHLATGQTRYIQTPAEPASWRLSVATSGQHILLDATPSFTSQIRILPQ